MTSNPKSRCARRRSGSGLAVPGLAARAEDLELCIGGVGKRRRTAARLHPPVVEHDVPGAVATDVTPLVEPGKDPLMLITDVRRHLVAVSLAPVSHQHSGLAHRHEGVEVRLRAVDWDIVHVT